MAIMKKKLGKAIFKNLKSGIEETVKIESLSDEIKKILWEYNKGI